MAKLRRGNVILTVEDFNIDRYLKLGYDVVSNSGEVITKALPTDYQTLQRLYIDQIAKITELENEVAKLTAENKTLKTKNKNSKSGKPANEKKNADDTDEDDENQLKIDQ